MTPDHSGGESFVLCVANQKLTSTDLYIIFFLSIFVLIERMSVGIPALIRCIMKVRKFSRDVLNHCYQRSADHGVLFYTDIDYLVFFTLFCVVAERRKIKVLKLVQMPNHIHHSSIARTKKQLTDFSRDCMSLFTREYNGAYGRLGPLMETPFSSAPKWGDKNVRTNLLYLDNNPVERKLVTSAEQYRWNYLAYGVSKHPFSGKIVLRHASMPLRRALERVKLLKSDGRYLTYRVLRSLLDSISSEREKEQLKDFIIGTYSVIDHQAAMRYFGGYDQELIAARSTTGSEYDISEAFIGKDDKYYASFTDILLKEGLLADIHDVLTLSPDKKQELFYTLRRKTSAPGAQICAFLHLPVEIRH